MIHPIPLDLREAPRPMRWRCTEHGELLPGQSTCQDCDQAKKKDDAA